MKIKNANYLFKSTDVCELKENEEYYAFAFNKTNKEDAVKIYSGVFKIRLNKLTLEQSDYISSDSNGFKSIEVKTDWELIEGKIHKSTYLHSVMYHRCDTIYTTKEEAIQAHNASLKSLAQNQTSYKKDNILKFLIGEIPIMDKKEVEALKWYKSLSKNDKEHVKWIKNYYDKYLD